MRFSPVSYTQLEVYKRQRHEPKKLAFYLSEQSGDDFVGISVHYSSCFRMFWRWDHYAVPLPFSTCLLYTSSVCVYFRKCRCRDGSRNTYDVFGRRHRCGSIKRCGSGFLQFLSEAYQTGSETGRKDRMDLQDLRICLRGRSASGRLYLSDLQASGIGF